ncbi:MAG: fructosamine kinase family protein [Treponema sp.]|nr:fructosamine kinase family protein [Treponema sp.]
MSGSSFKIAHYDSLDDAVKNIFGQNIKIESTYPVSGGDINDSYAHKLSDGTIIFMKSNRFDNESFFIAESLGLSAIAKIGAIKTPDVLCTGKDNKTSHAFSFLLLNFIQSAKRSDDYWKNFAHSLAAMHKAPQQPCFGFSSDNFIGATKQINTPYESWIDFFRDCRLTPQFKMADSYFDERDKTKIKTFLDKLDTLLVEPNLPSLLHGDLWAGNVMCGPDGHTMLIDPAVYIGHHEADIAMTELFGGFPPEFYSEYKKAFPLQEGYSNRRDIYNLYQLLNHLNLFGRSYLGHVLSIVDHYA